MPDPREELGREMQHFWERKFLSLYPDRVDMRGRNVLKQIVAQQMLDNILTDSKTHFESRLLKTVRFLLKSRCEVSGIGMCGDFESVSQEMRDELRSIMPREVGTT